MQCPVCNTEAVITSNKMKYDTEEQKLYRILKFSCRNKKCSQYMKEIGEEKREIPVDIE